MGRKFFWLAGGDGRLAALADLLARDGHKVRAYALEQALHCEDSPEGIQDADCVILPLPAADRQGHLFTPLSAKTVSVGELLVRLKPGQHVLAGRPSPWLEAAARGRGLTVTDYFAREDLALLNAIPTAEGAIRIAMETLPVTLHGANVLILGYGRLGQALGPRLAALGARVTVAARRSQQRALAAVTNLETADMAELTGMLHYYDLVINTAPALVLGPEELSALKEGTPVIDLASLPGGVDDETAAALGIRVIHALALPGKEAPLTAARYLRDTVYHILEGD